LRSKSPPRRSARMRRSCVTLQVALSFGRSDFTINRLNRIGKIQTVTTSMYKTHAPVNDIKFTVSFEFPAFHGAWSERSSSAIRYIDKWIKRNRAKRCQSNDFDLRCSARQPHRQPPSFKLVNFESSLLPESSTRSFREPRSGHFLVGVPFQSKIDTREVHECVAYVGPTC
jgi:hypothetical protein